MASPSDELPMSTSTREVSFPPYHPGTSGAAFTGRIASVDVVRGIVMVLMARDYRVPFRIMSRGNTTGCHGRSAWTT